MLLFFWLEKNRVAKSYSRSVYRDDWGTMEGRRIRLGTGEPQKTDYFQMRPVTRILFLFYNKRTYHERRARYGVSWKRKSSRQAEKIHALCYNSRRKRSGPHFINPRKMLSRKLLRIAHWGSDFLSVFKIWIDAFCFRNIVFHFEWNLEKNDGKGE